VSVKLRHPLWDFDTNRVIDTRVELMAILVEARRQGAISFAESTSILDVEKSAFWPKREVRKLLEQGNLGYLFNIKTGGKR